MEAALVGAIEAGGTKFVCAVGRSPGDFEAVRFPTLRPEETISHAIDFFKSKETERGEIQALGIGSFGPADVNPKSKKYGWITNTPKENWSHTDLGNPIREALSGVPMVFETDVNAAAWGEGKWGAAQGLKNYVYITVGTGIGGGAVVNGNILHGISHPEMGHLRIPKDYSKDPFPGSCPFHGDCLEGLASGTAMRNRWNTDPATLPVEHEAWKLESGYLADALYNLTLTLAPQRFILGGGVMEQKQLFPMIRHDLNERIAGYIEIDDLDTFIVPPGLSSRSGVLGALALAQELITKH